MIFGYPPIGFALVQALVVALIMLTPWMLLSFGTRLKTTGTDVLLMLPVYPVFAALTLLVFLPFEGDWADGRLGIDALVRSVLVGAAAVAIGTAITQRKRLARRGVPEAAHQLFAALLIGGAWGLVWGVSGWLLMTLGMASNG